MLTSIGRASLHVTEDLGGVATVLARLSLTVVRGKIDRRETMRAMAAFGPATLPVILGTAAFTGAIMVVQGALYVRQFGVESLVGWYTGFATFREIGPVLMALMFSGRVGASHTSELAAMRLREQLDALEIMALDVYEVFIAPRAIAMVLSLTLLVVLGDAVALIAGSVTARVLLGIDYGMFLRSVTTHLSVADFSLGIEKAAVFGSAVAVVSTHFGLRARGGSVAVGRAVNAQVVASAVGLFVMDYLVTEWLG